MKRTHLDPGLKLKPKYLGPYEALMKSVEQKLTKPTTYKNLFCSMNMNTCTECMKPWPDEVA